MDRPDDFLAMSRIAALPLALSGRRIATALAEELFPIGRHDAIGAGEQNAPLRAAQRRAAADVARKTAWNHTTSPRGTRASDGALPLWVPAFARFRGNGGQKKVIPIPTNRKAR